MNVHDDADLSPQFPHKPSDVPPEHPRIVATRARVRQCPHPREPVDDAVSTYLRPGAPSRLYPDPHSDGRGPDLNGA